MKTGRQAQVLSVAAGGLALILVVPSILIGAVGLSASKIIQCTCMSELSHYCVQSS